jgi:predicted aconitase with swiveling domain
MSKIILHGRKIHSGFAEGEAMVTRSPLGGFGCFDFDNGQVIDLNHEWYGQSVKGKVLVFTTASGSSAWTIAHQALRFTEAGPVAYVVRENNPQTALGSVVARIPCVADFDQDPTSVIENGDWVRVDAEHGIVEVRKNNPRREL